MHETDVRQLDFLTVKRRKVKVSKVKEIGMRGNSGGRKSVVRCMEKRSDAKGDRAI
jgi:hypothetical protein